MGKMKYPIFKEIERKQNNVFIIIGFSLLKAF